MQGPASNAYRLSQQIELTKSSIQSLTRQIAYTRLALKFGFITTWILYFIFVMGFYVADLWGLTTWLEANASEYIAFLIFLTMAILMATTLSMIKHVFYEHRAEFRYGLGIVLLIAALGVFFELFNASSQQQNIAYNHAEQSATFNAAANTPINLGNTDHSSRIAHLEGELATAQTYLKGCKKTCNHYQAKVANLESQISSLHTSQTAAMANAAQVAASTFTAKTEALQAMKEDYHKPVFKFVRDNFGVTISTAVVLIATLIAAGFEFSHALLSRILGEKLAALAGLKNQLINQEANHIEVTHDEPLPTSTPPGARHPIGFGIPSVATATLSEPVRFKYQAAPEVYKTPEPTKQGFIGFVNPDTPTPPTSHPVHRVKAGSVTSKLGSHEQQLSIPHFVSFKSGRDTFASPTLSAEEPTPLSVPNTIKPHSNAVQNGTVLPAVDSNEFALLRDTVLHERFDVAFLDLATGQIKCSQNAVKKAHRLGSEMSKWLMFILEAWEIITEPNPNKQNTRELIIILSLEEANKKLASVKTNILGA